MELLYHKGGGRDVGKRELIVFFNDIELCLHRIEHLKNLLIQLCFGRIDPLQMGLLQLFEFLQCRLKQLLVIGKEHYLLFWSPLPFDPLLVAEFKNNILRIGRTDIAGHRIGKVVLFRVAVMFLDNVVHTGSIT